MQSTFMAAINQLCDEKNISREIVIDTVKAALRAAYRKDYGNREQNVEVELDENSGNATVYLVKTVVKKVKDINLEIALKDALKYKKDAKVDDVVKIDVTPVGYGRIAAQSAKQVIIQRLQEAERDMLYEKFKDRENELLNALVHRVDGTHVYIDLDKITSLLPPEHQIPNERYYGGQRIKLYLDKVIKTTKGPQLLISRTHPKLVEKLLELEIPEIRNEVVTVKAVAREPGVRSKVAVHSNDPKVDPIGSCVGQKGVRIRNVMEELNGERIDIIQWSEVSENFIRASLAPAKVTLLKIDEQEKRAKVYVMPDQRPLAIGKQGQNVRLASYLTGYELDILDVSDLGEKELAEAGAAQTASVQPEKKLEVIAIFDLPGLNQNIVKKLSTANLTQVEQIKGLSAKDLIAVEGITEEEAEQIVEIVKKVK